MTEMRSAMPDCEGEEGHMEGILEKTGPTQSCSGKGCNCAGLLIKDLPSTTQESKILNS